MLGAQGEEDLQNAGIRRTRKTQDRPLLPPAALFPRAVHLPLPLHRSARLLDGVPGLIYHFMYSFMYRFLVDAKLYEAQKTGKYDTTVTALEAKD